MLSRTLYLELALILLLSICYPLATSQALPNPSEIVLATAEGGNPRTLDPAWAYDTASGALIFNVYEPLIFFDREKTDQFVPMLASSWTVSADGLTYTFKIRGTDGSELPVKFHNGHMLTTEDVEYSFKRSMVQDRYGGPAWMLYEPLLNRLSSRDDTGNIAVTADQINNAITHTTTTVTFHLAMPYPPFLQILSEGWSSILSKDWCTALGDWPGTWDNWQNYNNPNISPIDEQNTEPPGPHLNAMCGTGPYYFEYLDSNLKEWSIRKFDDYWHGWPSTGAKGSVERARATWNYAWQDRRNLFLAGQCDVVSVPRTNIADVLGQPGVRSIYPLPELSCSAMFFTFNISESSPYMGVPGGLSRGTLDESGIPPDFFTDIDVRKGFAYSVNYSKLIEETLLGEAYQPATPIVWGLPFYNSQQEKYGIDMTKAEEHFRSAWSGQLWMQGFHMTICYIEGNFLRMRLCEMIESNVESLNSKFHIDVTSIPIGGGYNQQMMDGELPIFQVGWLADFSDPHNFAIGFMYSHSSTFASWQRYANATIDSLVEAGIRESDIDRRRQIYYDLQSIYHEDCPGVPLNQPRGRRFERDWVQGWYYNPLLWGMEYFYSEWKEEVPPVPIMPGSNIVDAIQTSDTKVLIETTTSGSVSTSKHNINVEGTIPGDIVNIKCVTVDTTLTPDEIIFPIEIRIYYTSQEIISAYVDQSTLRMYYWNETTQEWVLESNSGWVTPSDVPGYNGYVWARIYHLSTFAAMGKLQNPPPTPSVGGEWSPIDKLQPLAPWVGLASTIAVAASFVVVKHVKKRQD